VPGEGGLHRDGGGLLVPDLPDHDDVRVLPQEGTERGGEGQADRVVHVHLVDPVKVVLDRVLGGHDVGAGDVHFGERRVERRRLAAAGRAGHQDHAVGAGDRVHEVLERGRLESELRQVERQVPLVEDPEHDLLPEDGRERGDAQVDRPLEHPDLDAAVLRDPPFRDVELRHDLDAGEDRRLQLKRGGRHLLEHAVDPEAHAQLPFVRLDVDVARTAPHRLGDEGVDELDDRGLVRAPRRREFRLLRRRLDDLDLVALHRLHDVSHRLGLVVQAVDGPLDLPLGGDVDLHLVAGHELDVVDGEEVGGVGHGHAQRAAGASDRHDLELARDLGRDHADDGRIDLDALEIDAGGLVKLGQELEEALLGEDAELDEGGAEGAAFRPLDLHRLAEVGLGDEVGLDKL